MRISKAVALALVLTLTAIAPVAAGDADWSQDGYDGGHSRFNVAESTLRPRNVSRLRLDWIRRIRPDVTFIYEYMADPFLVADGRVFGAWSGSEAPYDVLVAFDESTGERLWTRRFVDGVRPVAASASTVVVVRWLERIPGVLALDAATGSTRWAREGAEPLVADRMVRHLIAVERESDVRRVLSVKVETGEVGWSRRLHIRQWYPSVLLSRRRVVVAASTDRGPRVVVLRSRDGTTARSQRMRGDLAAIADGRILTQRNAPRTGELVFESLRLGGGPVDWEFRVPYYAHVAAAGGDRVFVNHSVCVSGCEGEGFGLHRGAVIALDAATGSVLWRRRGNEGHGDVLWQAGALVHGLLFVDRYAIGRGHFGALDPATGHLRWVTTFEPTGVHSSLELVANGGVFGSLLFGKRGGRIVRFALPSADPTRVTAGIGTGRNQP
jgi:outer membrane protein assembly factor BamB